MQKLEHIVLDRMEAKRDHAAVLYDRSREALKGRETFIGDIEVAFKAGWICALAAVEQALQEEAK